MAAASKPATASARPAHGLTSPDKFFVSMRPLFGTMTKTQVEGIEAKLAAFGSAASPLKHVAYGSQPHITRPAKMQPVT
jgi:hypothetical protein